jgi:hypothetical protein
MFTISLAYEKAKYADMLRNIEKENKYRPFYDEIDSAKKPRRFLPTTFRYWAAGLLMLFKMH